jgi:glycosyltransferase involved in cell wall biosynthesis
VVASDIPAVREVVEPDASGLLVPPGDPESLANAMDAMLTDRDRAAAFGRRGREIFEERFTLERSVQGMLELYHRLTSPDRQG